MALVATVRVVQTVKTLVFVSSRPPPQTETNRKLAGLSIAA